MFDACRVKAIIIESNNQIKLSADKFKQLQELEDPNREINNNCDLMTKSPCRIW